MVYVGPIQWRLLAVLMSDPGHVFTYRHLAQVAWPDKGSGFIPETDIRDRLQWHISQLKLKLGNRAESIQGIFGFGYKFNLPED